MSSLDTSGNVDKKFAQKIMKKNNLISVSKSIEPSYYIEPSQASLHRILLCSALKTTLPKVQAQIRRKEFNSQYLDYFTKDDKCIRPAKVSKELKEIYDSCEEYDILNPPMLPTFVCPKGLSQEEYLTKMARSGYTKFLSKKVGDDDLRKTLYGDRFRKELKVIKDADLFGYFLIVQDIIRHVEQDMGWLAGPEEVLLLDVSYPT